MKCPSCKSQEYKAYNVGNTGYAGIGDFDDKVYTWKGALLICGKCGREHFYQSLSRKEINKIVALQTQQIADKLKISVDDVSQFPIYLSTQNKSEESLFYVQLNKAEAQQLIDYLTKAVEQL